MVIPALGSIHVHLYCSQHGSGGGVGVTAAYGRGKTPLNLVIDAVEYFLNSTLHVVLRVAPLMQNLYSIAQAYAYMHLTIYTCYLTPSWCPPLEDIRGIGI
jgi:hypothetical protein